MGGMKRTILYHRYAVAKDCFDGRGYTNFEVHGYCIKYQWLGMTWYRIKIYRPRVRGVIDGCVYSNAKLGSYAGYVRQELKRLLYTYKYGNPDNK